MGDNVQEELFLLSCVIFQDTFLLQIVNKP